MFRFGIIDVPPWCRWGRFLFRFCFAMMTILDFFKSHRSKPLLFLQGHGLQPEWCQTGGIRGDVRIQGWKTTSEEKHLEIVDVGMLSREVLQKYLEMFGSSCDWMIGWFLPNEWMSENDVGLFVTVTPLVFHQTILLTLDRRFSGWFSGKGQSPICSTRGWEPDDRGRLRWFKLKHVAVQRLTT